MEGCPVPARPRIPEGLHTMGEVRRLTGLTDRQIRYYDQHGLVMPTRSAGRHRLFTATDVARLMSIKRWLARGLTLTEVGRRLGPAAPGPQQPPAVR